MTGDERMLLDSFSDDVVSENRYVELNTDVIPRGHLTLTGFDIKSDEFANPNVWLRMVVEDNIEIKRILAKVRAIPILAKFDLVIHLSSEIDVFKCSQAIMDTLWLYRFMYFEYNFMNIDAIMIIPDGNQMEIVREKNMTSDNTIKLTLSFEVHTYYPAFKKPRFDTPDPKDDRNKTWSNAYDYDPFRANNPDVIVYPKRTRWYSNIEKARENGILRNNNINDDKPINNQVDPNDLGPQDPSQKN
jgi:hypothetical protein